MSLANLLNVPRSTEDWAFWSFSNQVSHVNIAQALASQKNIDIPVPAMDPIPFFALSVWLQNHQNVHNLQNAALGIGGSDLTSLNFDEEGDVLAWLELHFSEHQNAEEALRIS